eukprot:GHVH01010112.1.p1 GENE.GHVH01010112.1~~GHVH01010112.1.p1  ORF type:complete len:686 (-),score=83.57 GHVH01010112.1:2361-4166(-)
MVYLKNKVTASALGCLDMKTRFPLLNIVSCKDMRLRFVANYQTLLTQDVVDTNEMPNFQYKPVAFPDSDPPNGNHKRGASVTMASCGFDQDVIAFSCRSMSSMVYLLRLPAVRTDPTGRSNFPPWTPTWQKVPFLSSSGVSTPPPNRCSSIHFFECLSSTIQCPFLFITWMSSSTNQKMTVALMHIDKKYGMYLDLQDPTPTHTVTSMALCTLDNGDRALLVQSDLINGSSSLLIRELVCRPGSILPTHQQVPSLRISLPRLRTVKEGTAVALKPMVTDESPGRQSTTGSSETISDMLVLSETSIFVASNYGSILLVEKGEGYTIRSLLPPSLSMFIKQPKSYNSVCCSFQRRDQMEALSDASSPFILVTLVNSNGLMIVLFYSVKQESSSGGSHVSDNQPYKVEYFGLWSSQTLPGQVERIVEPTGQSHERIGLATNANQFLLLPLVNEVEPQRSFVGGCAILLWRGIKKSGGIVNLDPHPTIRGLMAIGLRNGDIALMMERNHERIKGRTDSPASEGGFEVPLIFWIIFDKQGQVLEQSSRPAPDSALHEKYLTPAHPALRPEEVLNQVVSLSEGKTGLTRESTGRLIVVHYQLSQSMP